MNRTMPSCTIIPVLIYPDVNNAISWLTETFGFVERWRVGNHRAQLTLEEDTIAISKSSHESLGAVSNPAFHSLLVRISDVDNHYEKVKRKGARIIQVPANFPYGERQYTVQDPGGHHWTFSQSIADLAPEEWGGKTATNG